MTKRILAALLALTAALLVAAVVPLALKATQHVQESYTYAAEADARSLAAIALDNIDDNVTDPRFQLTMKNYAKQGDELLLASPGLVEITGRGTPLVNWREVAAKAIAQSGANSQVTKTRVVVAVPVWEDNRGRTNPNTDNPIGVVVLERPTAQLDDSTSGLWLYVGVLAAIAMLAAAAIAVTFARWVSKPLVTMDVAARKLADGDLSVRAVSGSGPPELRRMAVSFNMMAGRLETLVHGHRAMLADVSHQLRTPLAALRLRIDLLASDVGPTAQAELAGRRRRSPASPGWWTGCSRPLARSPSPSSALTSTCSRPSSSESLPGSRWPTGRASSWPPSRAPTSLMAPPGRRSRLVPGTSSRSSTTCLPTRSRRCPRAAGSRSACPRRKTAHD